MVSAWLVTWFIQLADLIGIPEYGPQKIWTCSQMFPRIAHGEESGDETRLQPEGDKATWGGPRESENKQETFYFVGPHPVQAVF